MRYETVDISGRKVLWDNKKRDYVREGDAASKELVKKVKELQRKNFVVSFLSK